MAFLHHFLTVDLKSFCCVTDFDLFLWICQSSFYVLEPWIAGKNTPVLQTLRPLPYIHTILATSTGILAFIVLLVTFLAPQVGAFETDLTVNGLKQAATNISQTKVMTERADANSLGIADGTMLIGDSVALRANTALQTALPGAQINAQVSRTTKTANEIMLNNSQNKISTKDGWLLQLG